MGEIAVHLENGIKDMSSYTSPGGMGTTRLPFTQEAKQAAEHIAELMKEAGLHIRIDESGAIIGRLEGRRKECYIIASHYDTVENGGDYDGIAGILCGIEIAGMMANFKDREYSLEIIATNDEEGARFSGGFFSSKAMLGEWTQDELKNHRDKMGICLYDAMIEYGLRPKELYKAQRNLKEIKGFFEIHIEQGPILEMAEKDIGIVKAIVGMERRMVTVYGRADHAGTTPMKVRKDAVEMASRVISKIGDCARKYPDTVATVGYVKVFPNAVNTIPDKVEFSVDIRSAKKKNIEQVLFEVHNMLSRYTVFEVQNTLSVEPVEMNKKFGEMLAEAAEKRGYLWQKIISGAGHDSLPIGRVIPTAMLFVPSVGGRSHCPEEYTRPEDLEKAVWVLFDVVKNLLNYKEE